MKIFLYSYSFYPNIGGVEDVGHAFARLWVEAGHEVVVVTETEAESERPINYQIYRKPSLAQLAKLVNQSDIVFTSGTTPRLFPLAFLFHKPFVWAHHGYQLSCIDGAGWAEGQPAPMTPWASICWHAKLYGWPIALIGGIKLYLRRLVAHLVASNVATSHHLAKRQPLPRQTVIYNPFDAKTFAIAGAEIAENNLLNSKDTFTYLGRLVSEKGVDDLLYAFAALCADQAKTKGQQSYFLKIVGDGPERSALESLAAQLNLGNQVKFVGSLHGDALKSEIDASGIFIIPSAWEEPGALVVLILLAAGKPLIVSQDGWLSECAGPACLTFANRDRKQLASVMHKLVNDKDLQLSLVKNACVRINEFDPEQFIQAYLSLFERLIKTT